MHRGYLAVWRKFFEEHPFWQQKRKFSRAEAWIDILKETHFMDKPKQRIINDQIFIINYGECVMTTRYCARRWGWTQSAVHRFIVLLKKMEQIDKKPDHRANHIIVLNYEQYDPKRITPESRANQTKECKECKEWEECKYGYDFKNCPVYNKAVKKYNTMSNFNLFWARYPNKVGKDYAKNMWKKRNDIPEIEVILNAVDEQIKWRDEAKGAWRPDWKNPSTWINQGCWNDACDPNYGRGDKKETSGMPDRVLKNI